MEAVATKNDPAEAEAEALAELRELGLGLARAVQSRAVLTAEAPPPAAVEAQTADNQSIVSLTAAFERVARCVRRTILLARHLRDNAPPTGVQARAAVRRRILREVEDAIEREAPERAETLRAELLERIERPEFDEDLELRPVEAIILDIKRDLAATDSVAGRPYWKRRTPNDIAELHTIAARPRPQLPATNQPERVHRLDATPMSSPSPAGGLGARSAPRSG